MKRVPSIPIHIVIGFLLILLGIYVVERANGQVSGLDKANQAVDPIFGISVTQQEQEPIEHPHCSLVFPSNDLTKIVIQRVDQTIVLDAKEFTVDMRPGQVPVVTCRLFRGAYRPTTPTIKKWQVKEIKFVEPDVFQRLIDEAVLTGTGDPAETPKEPAGATSAEAPKQTVPVPPTIPLNPNAAKKG